MVHLVSSQLLLAFTHTHTRTNDSYLPPAVPFFLPIELKDIYFCIYIYLCI